MTESNKSRLVAFLLSFFLGGLGVHRFYVGKMVLASYGYLPADVSSLAILSTGL